MKNALKTFWPFGHTTVDHQNIEKWVVRRLSWVPKPYVVRWKTWNLALQAFVERVNRDGDEPTRVPPPSQHATGTSAVIMRTKLAEGQHSVKLGLRYKVLVRDRFRCVRCGSSPATKSVAACTSTIFCRGRKAARQFWRIYKHFARTAILAKAIGTRPSPEDSAVSRDRGDRNAVIVWLLRLASAEIA